MRSTHDLEEAHIASGGIRKRLLGRLEAAGRNLRSAKQDFLKYKKDAEVNARLDECEEALGDLNKLRK